MENKNHVCTNSELPKNGITIFYLYCTKEITHLNCNRTSMQYKQNIVMDYKQ